MSHRWYVDTQEKADFFILFIKDQLGSGNLITYNIKTERRSDRQNAAIHLWFRHIADQLNEAGHYCRHPFNDDFEIPFTEITVKELLFKPVITAMWDKAKTSDLEVKELSESSEALVRWLSSNKGIYCPLPQKLKDEFK